MLWKRLRVAGQMAFLATLRRRPPLVFGPGRRSLSNVSFRCNRIQCDLDQVVSNASTEYNCAARTLRYLFLVVNILLTTIRIVNSNDKVVTVLPTIIEPRRLIL